ncbi:peptidoglycan DD-metalloendopeptidase family protein [Paenibacillus sp. HJGM_3]|uniref:M23 family metallopeptidase n=1 Tax=Paenibacillus sp. HJGM_3 TaxID=3379816 RepID=UPI0038706E27
MKKKRLKWLTMRLTFMVFADANSNVVRFRMPVWMFLVGGVGLSILISLTLSFYTGQSRSLTNNERLQNQLTDQTQEFASTVTEKNDTIEHLQKDLLRLSQQAEEVKGKIEELKKLESEMKSLTGALSMGDARGAVSIASALEEQGIGGDSRSSTKADFDQFVSETAHSFASLDSEMTGLFGSLTATKQQVEEAQHQLAITPTIWPTISRTISSPFGLRIDPFTRTPSFHNGIDISAKLNDPVWAAADGTVVSVGWDSTSGNNVIVQHTNELRTRYMHLNKYIVAKGDQVKKGQQIGMVGSTGRSTGYHLHYGVIKNGETIDPRPYLKASRKED